MENKEQELLSLLKEALVRLSVALEATKSLSNALTGIERFQNRCISVVRELEGEEKIH